MTGVFGVVLGQILLMFLYLIIGYVLYRTGLITQEGSKALAHLLLYCVLPCVVLKSFCIEYSEKGAVERELWSWLSALRQVPGRCCSPWRCRGSFFAKPHGGRSARCSSL